MLGGEGTELLWRLRRWAGRQRERLRRCRRRGDDAILASLAGLRADLEELSGRLDAAEKAAESLPHRARYLRLVHSLGRRLLAAHEEWADEVERELGPVAARARADGSE